MEVLDEPLYANFLRETGAERPYREKLLSEVVSRMKHLSIDVLFNWIHYPPGKVLLYLKCVAVERCVTWAKKSNMEKIIS